MRPARRQGVKANKEIDWLFRLRAAEQNLRGSRFDSVKRIDSYHSGRDSCTVDGRADASTARAVSRAEPSGQMPALCQTSRRGR